MSGFKNPLTDSLGSLQITAIKSPNFITQVSGWTIKKDGSAEFNNLQIRGTFLGTQFVINNLGAFFYSGTPATGNLIASITGAAGADDGHGNAFKAGVSSYGAGGSFLNLLDNVISIGSNAADTGGNISGGGGQINYASGISGVGDANSSLVLISKLLTLGGTNSQVLIAQGLNPSPLTQAMLEVQGNLDVKGVVNSIISGAEETFHTLAGFATGFSVTGAAQYKMCASPPNHVALSLRNIAYSGAGTNVDGTVILSAANGLPAAYQPLHARRLAASTNLLRQPSAGVFESCSVEVEADGSLQIFGMAAAATRLDCYGIFPLDAG